MEFAAIHSASIKQRYRPHTVISATRPVYHDSATELTDANDKRVFPHVG